MTNRKTEALDAPSVASVLDYARSRRAELVRKLDRRDETQPFDSMGGFAFLYSGGERVRMEEHRESLEAVMAMLGEPASK